MAIEDQFQAAADALKRGDHAQAVDALRAAAVESGQREDVVLGAADMLLQSGHANAAIEIVESALNTSSADGRLLGRLGQRLLIQGHLNEAADALQRASALQCDETETYVAFGLALYHLNRKPESVAALEKALELKPDNHEAAHMLAAFSGADIKSAAPEYIEKLFNNFAARFDEQLVGKLGYRTPQDVVDVLRSVRPAPDAFARFLDIGCGTGLIAEALKTHYRIPQSVGVDISRKMIEVANAKKLYENLVHGNATDLLYEMNVTFDLIAAIEVPIYLGDLWSLTGAVADRLKPGGLYVYSIETMESGAYKLLPTQRFAHTVWYVENIASSFGLKPVAGRHVDIRLEVDTPVAGYVGVLMKSEGPA